MGLVVCVLLVWQALDRVLTMESTERLWTDAIEKLPDDPRAVGRWFPYLNRGADYVEHDRFDFAMRDFERSAALGDLGMGTFNIGSLLSAAGKQQQALAAFDRAEKEGYNLYNLPLQRGLALAALGDVAVDPAPPDLQHESLVADGGALALDVVHQQPVEGVDLHLGVGLEHLARDLDPLLHREHRRLLRVDEDGDDDPIEHARAARDDVDVAVGQRIERPGVYRERGHGRLLFPFVKRQRRVAADHLPHPREAAGDRRRLSAARMLEHEQPAGRDQHARGGDHRGGLLVVRRIEPDDVEQFVGTERRGIELIDRPRDGL